MSLIQTLHETAIFQKKKNAINKVIYSQMKSFLYFETNLFISPKHYFVEEKKRYTTTIKDFTSSSNYNSLLN